MIEQICLDRLLGVVEQAHSIFYILQDYSSLTLVERRGGWMLEVVVVVREQETDNY